MTLLDSIKRDLKIPPWASSRQRELELYAEMLGEKALLRQVELAKTHWSCCWNHKDEGHHSLCPVGRKKAA